MKRLLVFLLALLLCLGCASIASAEKAGDKVTIPITLNNTDAAYVKISVSYDSSVFELVEFTCNGTKNGTTFVMADLNGVASGKCGSITLKIKDDAPAGTYTISASVKEAWTAAETAATASAAGGTVTVVKPADPTEKPADPTEKPADPTEKPADPTEKPTDPTEKPADPTEKPADPTEKPADPTEKPADPTEKPADPTEKPADPTEKPADPTEKPADPTEKPAAKPTEKPEDKSKFYSMTVSSIGPRFKDVSELTEKWHMFSVVDLSQDGVQTLDLIAGDVHKIGTVTLTVANGTVTVDYDFFVKPITVQSDFFTFFSDLAAIETVDTNKLNGYKFGEAITIGDDTNVIFYLKMNLFYARDNKSVVAFDAASEEYTTLVDSMLKMMD